MANYFILQENDESAAYAFKVILRGYRPEPRKNQREQNTVTGALDVQVAPNDRMWSYTIKLMGDESATFSVLAGSIMTATSVKWGDYDDLVSLFENVIPPTNKFRFRDMNGDEFYVVFTGSMRPKPVTSKIEGEGAYLHVDVIFRKAA
jgi:hypothetical protein